MTWCLRAEFTRKLSRRLVSSLPRTAISFRLTAHWSKTWVNYSGGCEKLSSLKSPRHKYARFKRPPSLLFQGRLAPKFRPSRSSTNLEALRHV